MTATPQLRNAIPAQHTRAPQIAAEPRDPHPGPITPAGRRSGRGGPTVPGTAAPGSNRTERHDHDCWTVHDRCAVRAAFDLHALRALWLADQDGPAAEVAEAQAWAATFQAAHGARREPDPGLVEVARFKLAAYHGATRQGGARVTGRAAS